MKVLVSITLLLFELLIISAHVLPSKLQNSQPKETLPQEVYEIIEGGSEKTSFSAPKHEKPTLREIIYYHVIERPYGDVKLEKPSEPLKIEMDDTMRAFTNGHGYQLADMDLNETESHESPNLDSEETDYEEEEDSAEEESEDIETTTLENTKENNDVTTEEIIANEKREITTELTTHLPKTTLPSEEKKLRQRSFLFDRLRERYSASFKKNTTPLQDPVTSTTEKEVISTETAEINKTSESTTLNPGTRIKRDLNYEEIPISPTLGPIDYSQYPGLGVISEQEYGNGNRDLNKGMRFKINDIFATMKPFIDNVQTEAYTPDSKVKTYGVNLAGDQGNVWNNMWRPINYHVGEPMKFYEVNEYEVSTVPPKPVEIATEPNKDNVESTSASNQNIYVDTKKKAKGKGRALAFPDDTEDELKDTVTPKDFEDIYVESSSASYRDIYVDTKKGKGKRKPSVEKVEDKETNENNADLDSKEEEEILEASTSKPIQKKPVRKDRPHKDTKSDLYEQLMNSDKFWKWLAHWTSSYMEVLSANVKDMVKKEVAEEMEQYKNKNDKKPEITKNKEPIIKNNTLNIDDKKIPITNTSNLDANIDKDFLKKHRDVDKKPNHNKLNETKVENNKTINNKVTPNVTKNEENHNDVNAHNIYGSATGNDHVTNVFIFYPGSETEKIMESLKPFIDTSVSGSTIKDKKDKVNKQEDKITETPKETDKVPDFTTQNPELNDKTTIASTTSPSAEKITEKPESTSNNVNVTEDSKPSTVVVSTEKSTETSIVSTEATSEKSTSEIEKVNTKEIEATTVPPSTEMNTETSIVSTESNSVPTTTELASIDKITTEKNDSSSVQTSTEEITEKTIDTTESTSTIASSEKP